MNIEGFSVDQLLRAAHSPIRNYIVPGLTSSLIGERGDKGTVRLFECARDHQEAITPHSHRFDFQCVVLAGSVRNRIWSPGWMSEENGDLFCQSTLVYGGAVGEYETRRDDVGRWSYRDHCYSEGQCYSMTADQVHSIYFSRGTKVLFFEGPTTSNESTFIEPWIDGETIPTFRVEPWMFKRAAA